MAEMMEARGVELADSDHLSGSFEGGRLARGGGGD
jgi:hypothetical protein